MKFAICFIFLNLKQSINFYNVNITDLPKLVQRYLPRGDQLRGLAGSPDRNSLERSAAERQGRRQEEEAR